MGLFDKLFGSKEKQPASPKLQEQALSAIDEMNLRILEIEQDPDIPDEQKAEKIARIRQELKTFAESMGWKYEG